MSCAVSCSTDSGVRNPATVLTLVAAGATGGAGRVEGLGSATDSGWAGGVAGVSDAGGALSTRWQAAPRVASVAHRNRNLMVLCLLRTPSPVPAPVSAHPPPGGPPRAGLPGTRGTSIGTSRARG